MSFLVNFLSCFEVCTNLDELSCVVIVSTVVTPSVILAGTASLLIQNDTQDSDTISMEGM